MEKLSAESFLSPPLIFGMFAFTGKGHEPVLILSTGEKEELSSSSHPPLEVADKKWGITHLAPLGLPTEQSMFLILL